MSVRPNAVVGTLRAYDPGHDLPALRHRHAPGALVELGSNENSIGPSPRVLDALRSADADAVWRYPDPQGGAVRRALAERLGLSPDGIVLGNGSHELLMLVAQCVAEPGVEVVFSEFGFAVFPIATAAAGATPRRVAALPRSHAMPRGHDLAALAAAVGARTRLVYLANPNNPTGTWFTQDALAEFLARVPEDVLVVVDEAYAEYVDDPAVGSALALLPGHANLLVTRTFSKGYGLAGLRLGYALGHPDTVALINRLRESFNANALAMLAAEAALSDPDHLAHCRIATAAERERMALRLRAQGYFVHPSLTNFLLVDFEREAAPIESALMARGVVVRPMVGYGLPTCLRVTVGRPDENERLLEALGA